MMDLVVGSMNLFLVRARKLRNGILFFILTDSLVMLFIFTQMEEIKTSVEWKSDLVLLFLKGYLISQLTPLGKHC
jgi:hypothetical protein